MVELPEVVERPDGIEPESPVTSKTPGETLFRRVPRLPAAAGPVPFPDPPEPRRAGHPAAPALTGVRGGRTLRDGYRAGTYSKDAPGPMGRSRPSQIANITDQPRKNTTE